MDAHSNERTHGGNIWQLARKLGCSPREILDFSASINPYGPPPWLAEVIREHTPDLRHYPDPACTELIQAASRHYSIPADELVADNGTAEILHRIPGLLQGEPPSARHFPGCRDRISTRPLGRALIPVPAYADYTTVSASHGLVVEHIPLVPHKQFALDWEQLQDRLRDKSGPNQGAQILVFLGQPNNPTGRSFDPERLRRLAVEHPESWFIVDEAFADFMPDLDRLIVRRPPNVIVLLSLTKFYALPGLRLGLAAMEPELAQRYRGAGPDWSVNTLAQAVGVRCLQDSEFQLDSNERVMKERRRLATLLSKVPGVHVFDGEANFLLCRYAAMQYDVPKLAAALLQRRIAIRPCANFPGLDRTYFRVAVRQPDENNRLLAALADILGSGKQTSPRPNKRRTPALMFQGTCSSAGKSLLTAALCRIFRQDGFSPAPFKAQNMALNSGVTPDGGEIGRAQILQAQACGLEPDRRMNPILLKPNSETGSQVIVLGSPHGNMDVGAYIRAKESLRAVVHEAYDSLAAEHDVMVLEGAGSPAEINLKHHDLVNMAMARHAQAAVCLVGDIDRGGVFAALSGTMDLLDGWERDLIRGLVINKFRGQRSLLDPALDWITRRTDRPVLGVVPYLSDLGLPEEDSVAFKQGLLFRTSRGGDARSVSNTDAGFTLDVACLDLPHISNFTDLDSLASEPAVSLRLVRSAEQLGTPDLLILPGTKNVMADSAFIREQGLGQAIVRLADSGSTHILGICGGFQMLGARIEDPHGLESATQASIAGLGLLPLTTRLEAAKTLCKTLAVHLPSGLEVTGYEIHHGRTTPELNCDEPAVCMETLDGRAIGHGLRDKAVWGSYLHGIFDNTTFRHWLLRSLAAEKGEFSLITADVWDMESALDRLADHVRRHLDVRAIYNILEVS